MPHASARLGEKGPPVLCQRIAARLAIAHVAADMRISSPTGYRWWNRYLRRQTTRQPRPPTSLASTTR